MEIIHKDAGDLKLAPNFTDYEQTRASFSWAEVPELCAGMGEGPGFVAGLARHDWPGNVRELRNVVDATLAMGEPPTLIASGPRSGSLPPPQHCRQRALSTSATTLEAPAPSTKATCSNGNFAMSIR